ncbi:MAG TPA: response regulator [Anaerolineae bacterium]|nr:response regulator [Anaerolineae bacterium]
MTIPSAVIIEDDPHISEIFSRTLEPDFEVSICRDGSAALDHFEKSVPNLILLDLHLPFMSGETLLDHLCLDPRFANTKIVVISADLFWAEKLHHQVDATLYKPISLSQLREVVSLVELRSRHGKKNEAQPRMDHDPV